MKNRTERGGVLDAKTYELAEADYMSGMKYKDIAEKYKVSINTVKSWKKRYDWNRKKCAHKNEKVCTQTKKIKKEIKKPLEEMDEDLHISEELTDKQRLFCILYIRCFNATKAYQKAYQADYNVAAVNAHRLLKNAKIQNTIQELKTEKFNRELISEEDIVQMYIDILYADIKDYMNGNLIDFRNPYADGRLIKKISLGEKQDSIELLDKMKALQWLSDHMDLATEKQRAEIDLLKAKMHKDDENASEEDDGFLDALNASAKEDWEDEES